MNAIYKKKTPHETFFMNNPRRVKRYFLIAFCHITPVNISCNIILCFGSWESWLNIKYTISKGWNKSLISEKFQVLNFKNIQKMFLDLIIISQLFCLISRFLSAFVLLKLLLKSFALQHLTILLKIQTLITFSCLKLRFQKLKTLQNFTNIEFISQHSDFI